MMKYKTNILVLMLLFNNFLFSQTNPNGVLQVRVNSESDVPIITGTNPNKTVTFTNPILANVFQNYDIISFERSYKRIEEIKHPNVDILKTCLYNYL